MRTFTGFLRGAGKILVMPRARAAHQLETGHAGQSGDLGVHTVAPSSIIAWFQSPEASAANGSRAMAVSRRNTAGVRSSPWTAPSRASTRATLPSSTARGALYAMLRTAAAV